MKEAKVEKAFVLSQVDFGKNDAKFDPLERYYLDTGIIHKIYSGDKSIIIGRKGTGKTAIAYYVKKQADREYSRFAEILSFKSVPVGLMEQFADKDHKLSNKYVILWKYIFLIEICKLLVKDQTLASEASEKLKTFINMNFPTLKRSPREYLKSTIEMKFKISLNVIEAERTTRTEEGVVNLVSFLEDLEELVIDSASVSNSYVVFSDELDDIYQNDASYYNIITAMFKAGMDLNAKFLAAYKKIRIVMLLRDDIYNQMPYSDKNKWSDMTENLDWTPRPRTKWTEQELFKLINLRVGASLVHEPRGDENYWNVLIDQANVHKSIPAFEFILSRTFFRPRDIIQFCKDALTISVKSNEKIISAKSIYNASLSYSKWFKKELEDELTPILPEVQKIFDAIKRHGKPSFFVKDIHDVLQRSGIGTGKPINEMFHILYDFSVVGIFEDKSTFPTFKYKFPDVDFKPKKEMSIHYGLRHALELVRRARK